MSVSREDIKKGMKQDAAAAWAKIKKLAGRWWVYGAVALGVGGSSAPLPEQNASLGASPFEQSLNEGSRRLENKLKISEMKNVRKPKSNLFLLCALMPRNRRLPIGI